VTNLPSAFVALVFSASCCVGLGGCVVAVVGGAAAGGGYVMGQERGADGTFSDTGIKSKLESDYIGTNAALENYVDINVFEGRVLLTGDVPTPDLRDQAVAIAWKVDGVKEVINEIQLASRSNFGSNANDNWIQTRLRTELTFDPDVRSLNYSIETVDGVVYILGIARTQAELDTVLNHARNMANVRKVVNYVRIRSGAGPASETDQSAAATPAPVSNGTRGTSASQPQYQSSPQYQPPPSSAPIQAVPLK
jgi:osmotically-inducible protein OsmY